MIAISISILTVVVSIGLYNIADAIRGLHNNKDEDENN